jgi:putative GTP pyrophosphokinase
MAGLTASQRGFLDDYSSAFDEYREKAEVLGDLVSSTLSSTDVDLHLVSARAKSAESLRLKTLTKRYEDPRSQVTDLLGVRVITYYGSKVDAIARSLREIMVVDENNSLDKRQLLLDGKTFGYRSVHLVGKVKATVLRDSRWSALTEMTFEVQIRSLLDHAWAEIEHEVAYKSGVEFGIDVKRRFAAVAGVLEILEREFLELRHKFIELVERHSEEYRHRTGLSEKLDAARLVAFLEVSRPGALGWRIGDHLKTHQLVDPGTCVAALDAVGIRTARDLETAMTRQKWRARLEAYSADSGISPDEASHAAIIAILVGHRDAAALDDYLPSLASLRSIADVFASE